MHLQMVDNTYGRTPTQAKSIFATGLVISLFFNISWALVFNIVKLLNSNIEFKKLTGNMVYTDLPMVDFGGLNQLFKAVPYVFGIWL